MNKPLPLSGNIPLRIAGTVALLGAVAWFAWRSIPPPRAYFAASEIALNRNVAALQSEFITTPSSLAGQYTHSPDGLRLFPGASVSYDVADLRGFLHGIFRDPDQVGAGIEIRAVGSGWSKVVFQYLFAPQDRDIDKGPLVFLLNPAELYPGTKQVLVTTPATSAGAVIWKDLGSVDRGGYRGLALVPLGLLLACGFQAPGCDGTHLLLHSPARLVFRVPSGRHRLTFNYGFSPAVFTDPKAYSDGIEFKVELETAQGSRELMTRLLEPFVRISDRKPQLASLDLDLEVAGDIALTATPGPAESISWDWSLLDNFRLEPVGQ